MEIQLGLYWHPVMAHVKDVFGHEWYLVPSPDQIRRTSRIAENDKIIYVSPLYNEDKHTLPLSYFQWVAATAAHDVRPFQPDKVTNSFAKYSLGLDY